LVEIAITRKFFGAKTVRAKWIIGTSSVVLLSHHRAVR